MNKLLRHVENVREGCILIGTQLIELGEEDNGRKLVANGHAHDHSKFFGIEWDYLNDGAWPIAHATEQDEHLFRAAVKQHVTTNPHHPEFWAGGIHEMTRVYLAEMVCDWRARASEQGTCIWEWIKGGAATKFGYTTRGRVYREIQSLLGMILEKKF